MAEREKVKWKKNGGREKGKNFIKKKTELKALKWSKCTIYQCKIK